MKLHSDFRDYYDTAIGYGIDEKVHYNRHQKKVVIDLRSELTRPFHRDSGLLGFCGIIYPFIELHKYSRDLDERGRLKIVETRFAFNEAEYIQIQTDLHGYDQRFYSYPYSNDPRLKQYFQDWACNTDKNFLEHKVPCWSAKFYSTGPNGTVNPRLKDYGFEKIKDPVAAFQELSMYLANILVEQKVVDSVDDRHRIEGHGFDIKQSFRHRKREAE
jgi:hypothetical protein